MSIQILLKRPPGLLEKFGKTYPVYHPNRVSGSKPCVGSALLAHIARQTQACLRMSSTADIRSLATLDNAHQVHSATTMHRQDTQQTRQLSTWDEFYPTERYIGVKNKGKNSGCERVKAVVTLHRDKRGRARRVWTPFSGDNPTKKDLAVKWPDGKQATVRRKLQCPLLRLYDNSRDDMDFYTVTEKLDVHGRRFWREVIPRGESTEEEEYLKLG